MYGEGPSIKYVTLFWPIFTPCHTLSHIPSTPKKVRHTSRTPNPHFLVGLVQKPGQKPSVQILSQFFAGFLSGGFCQEVFCPKGFVRGGFCPFPLLSEYICYNRKLNITLNFMFHMYDKKFISVTSHALKPPPPVPNCNTFSSPSSVTYF